MKLYEAMSPEITWWVASSSKEEVVSILKEELECKEYPEDEIEDILENLEVFKADKSEVSCLFVNMDYLIHDYSIWELFIATRFPGVIASDRDLIDADMEPLNDELGF